MRIILLSMLAVVAPAGVITSSTRCAIQTDNGTTESENSSECSLSQPGGFPRAISSVAFQDQGGLTEVVLESQAEALWIGLDRRGDDLRSASSSAEFSYRSTFVSEGPVRQGILSYYYGVFGRTGDTSCATGAFSIGAFGQSVRKCGYDGNEIYLSEENLTGIPFQLGESFDISLSASTRSEVSLDPGYFFPYGDSAVSVQIQWSLFESDGHTPVGYSLVPDPNDIHSPEPYTAGLVAAVIAAIAIRKRRTR